MTSTIKVDNIQNQCGANIINESSNTITLGASGDTVALASGASQSGFGRTGTVDWQTTIKTANFTAADGEGYFVDTNSSGITATLPAGSAGAIVAFKDYRNTFDSNALIVSPNGSDKIGGVNANVTFATEAQSVTLIYTDSTRGWIDIHDSTTAAEGNAYIVASGGTETTCGVYKIHTFTAPGTFTVSGAAAAPADNAVSYLVVGGGGGGAGQYYAGGGGGGGFRFANTTCMPAPQSSPLAAPAGQTVSVQAYPITVGAGGATTNCANGVVGGNSIFGTITAAGGGHGSNGCNDGGNGGSGGGGGAVASGGSGNTPSVSPAQGKDGGNGGTSPQGPQGNSGGGGGGASTCGANSTNGQPQSGNSGTAGDGGDGSYVISAGFAGCNGAPGPVSGARHFSGGGGGGSNSTGGPNGAGGEGGGGRGAPSATAGSTNTGGGGGSGSHAGNPPSQGAAGGSGIVIIRYKFQAS